MKMSSSVNVAIAASTLRRVSNPVSCPRISTTVPIWSSSSKDAKRNHQIIEFVDGCDGHYEIGELQVDLLPLDKALRQIDLALVKARLEPDQV